MIETSPPTQHRRPSIVAILVLSLVAGLLLIIGLATILLILTPPRTTTAPVAQDPGHVDGEPILQCGKPCFGPEDALALAPGAEQLATLGSPAQLNGAASAGIAEDWETQAGEQFHIGDGTPGACVFALSAAPIAPSSTSYQTRNDSIVDLGLFASDTATVSHVARVSESVMWGARYPNSIKGMLNQCPGYAVTLEGTPRVASVTPLDLEVSVIGVTDIAWRQQYDGVESTTVDLQRGNLIVRVQIIGKAGAIPAEDVRTYLFTVAIALAEL